MERISTYGQDRQCPHCGKRMSRYNPNIVCWADTEFTHLYAPPAPATRRVRHFTAGKKQWQVYFEMALDALDGEGIVEERYREPRASYWASVRVKDEYALTWRDIGLIVSKPEDSLKRLCYRFRRAGRYQYVTDLIT